MAFEPTDKEQLLEALMNARRQGQLAEISLRVQNKTAEAETLRERNARLSTEIDTLLGRMMDEWLGSAAQTIQGLTAANAQLEAAVAGIKKQIAVAQNVVKAVGLLDDALAIAKKVFAAI
jgi:hypothetical protein